ncbi:unnamed protein product [Caenorhabditis bovis]|uniref:Uncharacterized protein n=1 Tax=Caenorhabditis bovis TaxID=2654633 RepID=A0A8S1ESW7_9PELO|nr:unnamed protein product [Caenorhabditis bovis]
MDDTVSAAAVSADKNVMEEMPTVNSPATSISSLFSEQLDGTRNSPMATGHASPSLNFQRPEFLNTSVPDSETSSRSSYDGFTMKGTTAENIEKFKLRSKREKSSSGSDEDEECGDVVRKISSLSEEKFVGRAIDAPRGRIANIRRESNCSIDSEAAHEKMVKVSQQVSSGFDEFSLESERGSPSALDFRRRTPSFTCVGEPISVVTNAFIPHSCSPSPTRLPEAFKQCYSPSTQQIVRPNISYTPSPRGSPCQSPTRYAKSKILNFRSVSPISFGNRQPLKRKITGIEADMECKRSFIQRNNTSPLVHDKTYQSLNSFNSNTDHEFASPSVPHSPAPQPLDFGRNLTSHAVKDSEDKERNEQDKNDVDMDDDEEQAEKLLKRALSVPLPPDNF